jgi:glycosyltransferase involved in cell wall biosynthesis
LGLDKKRFNVIFIYLSSYGVEKNLIEEAGYKVFFLSNFKRVDSFRFSIFFRLVKILKKHNVDILHCHRHKPMVYGTIATVFAKTPVILSHVHGLGRSRNLRRKVSHFLLFRKINRIICVANSVREDVLRNHWSMPEEKISVLENSIDYMRFADVAISKDDSRRIMEMPSDAFIFGTIARLAPTKGLLYLIEAFQKVKEQKPSARLVLLGDGPCKAELEKQVSSMPCRDSIHFFGHRENIEQLLRGMDVFVLASVAEGMPRVILEAMAAGVPCVATEVGGIPEVIKGDHVEFLVPPGDSEALARAMISVANIPMDDLKRRIKKEQDRVRQFYSHDVVREKLKNLYEAELKLASKVNAGGVLCQK